MNAQTVARSATFAAESGQTAHEYYHVGRVRSDAAETVLSAISAFVSSVMIAKGTRRDELFEKFDLKLWSYDDNLARFALATLPSAAALGVLYAAHMAVKTVHDNFS